MYRVKEIFQTVQGEGYYTGRPCTMVRFAGCNLWSGLEGNRQRDHKRSGAHCPLWCDTDFVGSEALTAQDILIQVLDSRSRFVVLTGGEPLLQLDQELVHALLDAGLDVAVETNGTIDPDDLLNEVWVTCSPKQVQGVVLTYADELKLVWPDYTPQDFKGKILFEYGYLQPRCGGPHYDIEDLISFLHSEEGQPWFLSSQTHKSMGLR